jgi:hypothetical protein
MSNQSSVSSAKSVVREQQQTNKNERKSMNNKFDELAKGLAQSVTRRQALKKFGVTLAGMAMTCFGLANRAQAAGKRCSKAGQFCGGGRLPRYCCPGLICHYQNFTSGVCVAPV